MKTGTPLLGDNQIGMYRVREPIKSAILSGHVTWTATGESTSRVEGFSNVIMMGYDITPIPCPLVKVPFLTRGGGEEDTIQRQKNTG